MAVGVLILIFFILSINTYFVCKMAWQLVNVPHLCPAGVEYSSSWWGGGLLIAVFPPEGIILFSVTQEQNLLHFTFIYTTILFLTYVPLELTSSTHSVILMFRLFVYKKIPMNITDHFFMACITYKGHGGFHSNCDVQVYKKIHYPMLCINKCRSFKKK
jgi:hypothetical protein